MKAYDKLCCCAASFLQTRSTGHGCPRLRWPSPRRPETWCCPVSLTWTLSRTSVRTCMRCLRYTPASELSPFLCFFIENRNSINAFRTLSYMSYSLSLQTDKGFDKTMFERQMSVMRGQVSFLIVLPNWMFGLCCFSFSAFSLSPLCPLLLFLFPFYIIPCSLHPFSLPCPTFSHLHYLLCNLITTHFDLIPHSIPICYLHHFSCVSILHLTSNPTFFLLFVPSSL